MSKVINIEDQNCLVPTKQFPYAQFPFDNFNPIQSRVFEIYQDDSNICVAAFTASGKTATSEIFMSYQIRTGKGRAIYIGPLKSLARQKWENWSKKNHHFNDLKISVCTGDYRLTNNRIKEMNESDIVIMTPEMLASRTRNHKSEKSTFLKEASIITFDEAHLLTVPGRGDHIEVALMKLTEINPNVRVVLLSATMPNVNEICGWISNLTGRNTYCLESKYRPVPLSIHYESYFDGDKNYEDHEREKVGSAVGIVKYYSDDKFLVFVHTKRTGELMVKTLARYGIVAEFHNADLELTKRVALENKFEKDPDFRVLVATSTLAWGVECPARRVIITGVDRGLSKVENYDIWQMCVSDDARIMMHSGNAIFKKAKDVVVGDDVCGLESDGVLTNGKVLKIFHSHNKARRISFSNGTSVTVSNHPLLAWESGEWVNSDSVKIGDKICLSTKHPFSEPKSIEGMITESLEHFPIYVRLGSKDANIVRDMNPEVVANICGVTVKSVWKVKKNGIVPYHAAKNINAEIRYIRSKNGSELDIHKTFCLEFMWLMGAIASDGNVKLSKTHSVIRLSVKNELFASRFRKILQSFDLHCSSGTDKKGSHWVECASYPLANIVNYLGITTHKTWTIDVNKLLTLEDSYIAAFLLGVTDGDGHVSRSGAIRIGTASKVFAQQLREMLRRCSIRSSIRKFQGNGHVFGYVCDTEHYTISTPSLASSVLDNLAPNLRIKGIKSQSEYSKNSRPLYGDMFYTTVSSIEEIEDVKLINFSVEGCNTFFVEDIATHNCGRAGRPSFDPRGDAYILVPESKKTETIARLKRKDPIKSQLLDDMAGHHKTLAFHLVSEIHQNNIKTREGFHEWFKRSLAFHQNHDFGDSEIDKVVELLTKNKAVAMEGDEYKATSIGVVASMFYFSPFDAADLRKNFKAIFEGHQEKNDYALALALADLDSYRFGQIVNKAERTEMAKFQKELEKQFPNRKIPDTITKFAFAYYNMLNGVENPVFSATQATLRLDSGRTIEVLNALDTMGAKWKESDYFNTMKLRMIYGVKSEYVNLVQIPNVGRVRAEKLYQAKIRTVDDFLAADPSTLSHLMNIKIDKVKESIEAAKTLQLENML